MPKVIIVLIQWNNAAYTIDCLKSLEKIDYPNYEIIIIDNNSRDNDFEKLREVFLFSEKTGGETADLTKTRERIGSVFQSGERPSWLLVRARDNYGFSGGNNIGIELGLNRGTDYILLLNNDTEVRPDFLTKLTEAGENNPVIGMLSPRIYYYSDPDVIWFAGGRLTYAPTFGLHIGLGEKDNGQYQGTAILPSEFLTGCALFVRRETIEKIGFMPEDYFLYFEDVDWSVSAKKAGYKIGVVPSSRVWHKVKREKEELDGAAAYKEGTPAYVLYTYRNMLLYLRRHGSAPQKILTWLWLILFLAKQAIKLAFPSRRNYAAGVFRGVGMYLKGEFGKIF